MLAEKIVFIVEDDEELGYLLAECIEQETSCQPYVVHTASQAFRVVSQIKPHLFLLDYCLPDSNGLAIYDYLHKQSDLAHVPTIITSASNIEANLANRDVRFLAKPFEIDNLITTIEEMTR